ncbi:MAG: hypothetical protein WC292_05630 [Clostridia bacterium]
MVDFINKAKKIMQNELLCFGSMLIALIYGVYYLDLYDPLQYSLSEIGRLSHTSLFIIWSLLAGIALFLNVNRMYDRVGYKAKLGRVLLYSGLFFLVVTFANMSREPFWYWMHVVTAVLFSVFALFSVALGLLEMWKKSLRYRILSIAFFVLCFIDIVLLAIFTQMALYEFIPLVLVYIVLFFVNFTETFKPNKDNEHITYIK